MLFFGKKQIISSPAANESALKERAIEEFQNFIAPSAVDVATTQIEIGKRYARTIYVSDYPRFLTIGWLSPIINFNDAIDISLFLQPIDSGEILKDLSKRLTRIMAEVAEKQEKGILSSPLLSASVKEMEDMRDTLQEGKERMFRFGLYITFWADTMEKLKILGETIEAIFTNMLIATRTASLIQERGFNSTLPLASDELTITKLMNTAPLSTAFPFISADLTDDKGILYGINVDNNSLVIFDRFSLENANTIIIGKSGGGKSYGSKLEILRYLMFGTDIIIVDPENEYEYLARTVDGSYFKIALTSEHHINPFDLRPVEEGETPAQVIQENIIDLAAILKIMLGGFNPEEDALIDRAIQETYASRDITPEQDYKGKTVPTLADLQSVLDNIEGAKSIAQRLEKYTRGRFSGFFNQQTNIELGKRLVVFNIRDMEEELRPAAIYIIVSYIWKEIRLKLKKRLLFIDEAWWLLQFEESAQFLLSIAKRARKYYLGLTTITQDVTDFTKSRFGEPILTNSSLQVLFKQSPTSIEETKRIFGLTDAEKNFLLETHVGQGLFFAGTKHVTIQVEASYSENQIITSDPEEILKIRQAQKEHE